MLTFGLIFTLLIVGYCSLLLYYRRHWRDISEYPARQGSKIRAVILVPARNEYENVIPCLEALAAQSCTCEWKVIFVDDHSTDGTFQLVESVFADNARVEIHRLPEGLQGKKQALAYALSKTEAEVVLTTDADCVVGEHWLTSMLGHMGEDGQIVTGPVLITEAASFFAGFQALDLMSLAMITGGGIRSGLHALANGANLGYRQQAYRAAGGYLQNADKASGDDVFLIQNIADRYGAGAVAYNRSLQGAVATSPEATVGAFWRQRKRWASKNARLPQPAIQRIWTFVWLVNFAVLISPVIATAGLMPWYLVVVGAILKFAIEYLCLSTVARYYRAAGIMRFFPLSFFVNIVYVTGLAVFALSGSRYEWKGRKVS